MKLITLAATIAATLLFAPSVAIAEKTPTLPLETFAQLPQVSAMEFSPGGKYLMMKRPYNGRMVLSVQETASGKITTTIPPMEEFEVNWARWVNNDRFILSYKFEGLRNHVPVVETRLFAFDKDGQNGKYIIKPKRERGARPAQSGTNLAQIQDDVVHILPHDSDSILLSIDSDRDGRDEIRKVDVNNGNFKELTMEQRGVQYWMADQSGNVRYGFGFDTDSVKGAARTTRRMGYYFSPEGKITSIDNIDILQQGFHIIGFADHPDHSYLLGPSEHGTDQIIIYDMAKNETVSTVFKHETYSAEGLKLDPATDKPIGTIYSGNGLETDYFDADWQKRMKVINNALPATRNRVVSSTKDHKLHLIKATAAEDSGLFYVYDENNKSINPIIEIYPGLFPEHMGHVKAVTYKARDGVSIPAILTLPRGVEAKNLPTILLPHGGPHSHDDMDFDWMAQFLANRGYAVLQPNFRGSTGYGNAHYEAGKQQWGLAMQDDVTDGTTWLIDQGIADPKRICILGGSYGGYTALMGSVKVPNLYKCAASINGVSDIPRLLQDSQKYIGGTAMTQHINQDNQTDISPARRAGEIKAKVLLIHAEDDRTVDIEQAELMTDALKKAGNPAQFIKLANGGHKMDTEEARITVLTELEKFLKDNIGN